MLPMKFLLSILRKLFHWPEPKPTQRILSRWAPSEGNADRDPIWADPKSRLDFGGSLSGLDA